MEHTADHLVIIGRGQLIAGTSLAGFTRRASSGWVQVSTPQPELLARVLAEQGATAGGSLAVGGISATGIGD